jgi:hypothetical protein
MLEYMGPGAIIDINFNMAGGTFCCSSRNGIYNWLFCAGMAFQTVTAVDFYDLRTIRYWIRIRNLMMATPTWVIGCNIAMCGCMRIMTAGAGQGLGTSCIKEILDIPAWTVRISRRAVVAGATPRAPCLKVHDSHCSLRSRLYHGYPQMNAPHDSQHIKWAQHLELHHQNRKQTDLRHNYLGPACCHDRCHKRSRGCRHHPYHAYAPSLYSPRYHQSPLHGTSCNQYSYPLYGHR